MQIEGWARDGLSDEQISHNMGIAYCTLREWKDKFPAIAAALKKGKAPVDFEVENALLKSALGHIVKVKKPIKVKKVQMKVGEGRIETETVEYAEEEVYIPPNSTAQIFWLKNRRPEQWRDKREVKADVNSGALKNMKSIADLINDPQPDIDIEDITQDGDADE